MGREFRFGLRISNGLDDDPVALALQTEQAGFHVEVMGDHIGPEFAPIPTLAAIAAATTSIRLGTMVLNADVRNPVQLAWEAATIDRPSGGRFELGMVDEIADKLQRCRTRWSITYFVVRDCERFAPAISKLQ